MGKRALEGFLGYKGERGYSAYEIAVLEGYEGTEEEWINHFGLDLSGYVQTDDVVDDLTHEYTTRPLSAKQGKVLKDTINSIEHSVIPPGSILAWTTSTAPTGWLICDGSAISRTTYADLFDVLGTTYGSGDGSTTFNIPDLKGKIAVGQDTNDNDFDTLGNTGGSKELQAHNHGGYTSTNYAYNSPEVYVEGGNVDFYALNWNGSLVGSDNTYREKTLHNHEISTDGTGDSGNLQPYIVLNYIIKI